MSKSLATDGETLFSYMLPIAQRHSSENMISLLLTRFVSATTSTHLRLAMAAAKRGGWQVVGSTDRTVRDRPQRRSL
jgi:hypothetical protein